MRTPGWNENSGLSTSYSYICDLLFYTSTSQQEIILIMGNMNAKVGNQLTNGMEKQ